MRLLAALIAAVLLSACKGTIQMTKPGGTDAEYARDKQACESQASQARKGQMHPRDASAAHNRILLSCMNNRGWEQVAP